MRTKPEHHVGLRRSVRVEGFGIVEDFRVTVRGGQQRDRTLTGANVTAADRQGTQVARIAGGPFRS